SFLFVCMSVFFFSSRRRHTRSKRDWSSDVCSSDLGMLVLCVGLYFQSLDYPISNQELQRNVNQIVMQAKILYSFDILVQQIKTYDILLLRSEERRVGKECRSEESSAI